MLQVIVINDRQDLRLMHDSGPIEFGRKSREGAVRVVVEDRYVSRDQLRIEELPENRIRYENLGGNLRVEGDVELARGAVGELVLPAEFQAGYSVIRIEAGDEPPPSRAGLETIGQPAHVLAARAIEPSLAMLGDSPSPARLARWFETLISVQQAAAGSAEFYEEAARAVVSLVGLDRGMVLLRYGEEWAVVARAEAHSDDETTYSRSVVRKVVERKRTYYQGPPKGGASEARSLEGLEAVVASPIFGPDRQVQGVLYGSRSMRVGPLREGITPLEAQVVQVLAGAVSSGLARLEREAAAARTRVQFEQFFSPVLVGELERNPAMLLGHERRLTVLFCDLRKASRIGERLSTDDTYRLLGEIMDLLTNCIMDQQGVIVDYYGDGLAAMWNAPLDQPGHPALACEAALTVQEQLPELNARWEDATGMPIRIGVGIHTGEALVGNAGSRRRIKYGPRGHTVNLASRIEGATKYLGAPILVSGATRAEIGERFITRRLCRVRVANIEQPVDLYQLVGSEAPVDWAAGCGQYDRALELFEAGRPSEARSVLESLAEQPCFAADGPTRFLLDHCRATDEPFSPVIDLLGK